MRLLIILLIIFLLFRLAARFLFPFILRSFIRRAQRNFSQEQQRKEGEVTIERESEKKKKLSDEGEYVDFEEVE